jgi:hypothetical protein
MKQNNHAGSFLVVGVIIGGVLVWAWINIMSAPGAAVALETKIRQSIELEQRAQDMRVAGRVSEIGENNITIVVDEQNERGGHIVVTTDTNTLITRVEADNAATQTPIQLINLEKGSLVTVESDGPINDRESIYAVRITQF